MVTSMGFTERELEGLKMAIQGYVRRRGKSEFEVRSQSTDQEYDVIWDSKKWKCACEDYKKRGRKCKHIFAVIYYMLLHEIAVGVRTVDKVYCRYCGDSDVIIRRGFAYLKSGRVQRYYCKRCRRRFNYRSGLEGMRGEAIAIVLSLDLYCRGLSLRAIAQHLQSVYAISVSHTTIYNWIRRYVNFVDRYLSDSRINVGTRWHCDETVLKVNGRHLILWTVLDSETKMIIAEHLSNKKDSEEAYRLLKKALERSNGKPLEIVTDGLKSYSEAIGKIFGENGDKVIHIQGPLTGPVSNNTIERFYRTIKQRFKNMYSFKGEDGAEMFAKSFKLFYNNVRPHKSLQGKTPVEVAGGESTGWRELIKKFSQKRRGKRKNEAEE